MEIFWNILALILLLVALLGVFLPVIPGTLVAWAAMLLLYLTSEGTISGTTMIWASAAALAVQLLDFVLPLWGVKLFGGTKKGVSGATIGLLVATVWTFSPFTLLLPGPLAILLFPIVGAFLAELIADQGNLRKALGGAAGSLAGFFLTVGLRFILVVWYFYLATRHLIALLKD